MFITHVYESRHRQIARRLGNVMLCNCRFFQHFQRRLLSLLRNISILPILLPLHIILLDQPVDIPLDIRHRRMCVSLFSSLVSLSWTWLILTRYLGCEKSGLKVKVSEGEMSLDLGCLVRGRSLAQARDWRVRLISGSAVRRLGC
jgi:hypothetical protein